MYFKMMTWIVKVLAVTIVLTDLAVGEIADFEHAVVASVIPENILAEDNVHAFIFNGDPEEIYQHHLAGFKTESVILNEPGSRIYSCDANYRLNKLYVYEYSSKSIVGISDFDWRTRFVNKTEKIFHTGVSFVTKVAVDHVSDNVYWVDPIFRWIAMQPGSLETVDQSNFKILVQENLRRPTGLAVSPKHGYMFWSDSGRVPNIERADLIGQNRKTIISTGLIRAVAIDVDHVSSKIYWVDPDRDTIESSDFEGNNRRTIRRLSNSDLADIVVLGSVLAITEKTSGEMTLFDKDSGVALVTGIGPTSNDTLQALCLYTLDAQPELSDNCPAKNCSDICVNIPDGDATCLCREGYKLNADQRTCSEVEGEIHRALVVAGSSGICTLDIRSLASQAYVNQTNCFPDMQATHYMDIDMVNRRIYYTTATVLNSFKKDNSATHNHILTATDTITGMALDWRDGNIYMSLGLEEGNINIFSQTSKTTFTILDTDLYNPRELFLLPLDNLMLWINGADGNYRIEKAAMDGSNRETVLPPSELVNPKSITVDRANFTLYWTDEGIVKRCKMDGTEIKSLNISEVTSAHLVNVYKSYLIFTDVTANGTYIKTIDVETVETVASEFVMSAVGNVTAIATLDAHSQPNKKDPCEVNNGECEQICLSLGQNKICRCGYGFTLDANRATCSSTLVQDHFLLVSDWTHDQIYQVSLDNLHVSGLDTTAINHPTGVVYNHVTQQIVWGDTGQLVHRINLDGSLYEILVNLALHGCHADRFAIDYSTGNIFYTAFPIDDNQYAGVGVISPKGVHKRLVRGGERPRDIVLHPENGLLFWTDHGTESFVKKANMDGTSVTTIISTSIKWPNGLAIDQQARLLYLTDGSLNTIRRCNYQGYCSLLYTSDNAQLMDIALSGQYLYFTAWNRQNITRLNKDNISDIEIVVEKAELGRLDALAIYSSSEMAAEESSTCSEENGGCSTFCLATSGGGHTCACQDFVWLLSDLKTCADKTTTVTITATTRATLSPTPTTEVPSSTKQSLNIPAIAGGAGGGLLVIGVIVLCVIITRRRSRPPKRHVEYSSPYINPIPGRELNIDEQNQRVKDSEYDYIGLPHRDIKKAPMRKEDDVRKSVNWKDYSEALPYPAPHRNLTASGYLAPAVQSNLPDRTYMSFGGSHNDLSSIRPTAPPPPSSRQPTTRVNDNPTSKESRFARRHDKVGHKK